MSSEQFATTGPSRDPVTGKFLTREQLEEKYRWRQSYDFNQAEAQFGQLTVDDDGSNVQCLWASTNLCTGLMWLMTAGAFSNKFRITYFEDCSRPWGNMVGGVGFVSAFLGAAATGCCCDPMECAYMPFYAVNALYAAMSFAVAVAEVSKSRHSNNWGYMILALITMLSFAGSVYKKVLSVLEGSASSRNLQRRPETEMCPMGAAPSAQLTAAASPAFGLPGFGAAGGACCPGPQPWPSAVPVFTGGSPGAGLVAGLPPQQNVMLPGRG